MSWTNPSLVQKGSGAAESKNFQIVILFLSDILTFPSSVPFSVDTVGNYIMKPNKYVTELQVTSSKTSLPGTGEGEEDNISMSSLPEYYYPGSDKVIENLIQNALNKSVIVAQKIGACGDPDAFYRVYGSCAAPLTLIPEGTNNNDGTGWLLKFQQFSKTALLPKRYYGTFTKATANVIAADAVTVDATPGSGEYQLVDNTGATIITDIINATTGGMYTLIGSGGTNPATIEASNANFLLAGAVDWDALSGATLTVEAVEVAGGDHVFVERSRT
ncbi:hypothetical protein [Thalassobellus citreus]|uniref:hypothetical protein n=1 Tax=Thalassobellus citreus TaxID=3367752 RepID=UPI003797D6C1